MDLKDMTLCSHTPGRRLALQAAEQRGRERVMQICHGIEYTTNISLVVHNPNIMEAHNPPS